MIKDFKGKKIIIFGFARQGQSLASWLLDKQAHVTVIDEKSIDPNIQAKYHSVKFIAGSLELEQLSAMDIVFVSAGVPLSNPVVNEALNRGIPVHNDAELFLDRCPAPVIGITGSAGKTTTTTLVGEMLKSSGFQTWVGGNNGHVLLNDLGSVGQKDRVVIELSSFQLEIMNKSPQIACILNITPNHLDRHISMENYSRAKSRIFLFPQSRENLLVLNLDDEESSKLDTKSVGKVYYISMQKSVSQGAFLSNEEIFVNLSVDKPIFICNTRDIRLRGRHNIYNVMAATLLSLLAGAKVEHIKYVIHNFSGVSHRLEEVRSINEVLFINDSIATAPERVVAAINSFDDPLIILLGGKDKNLPWKYLIDLCMKKAKYVIVFGTLFEKLSPLLDTYTGELKTKIRHCKNLDQATQLSYELASPGDIVLLSPGGTAFDCYNNFEERGDHFRILVHNLK